MVRGLVVDLSEPAAVRLAEVPEPAPGPGRVVIDVHHVSLNRGDLNDAKSGRVPPGAVPGSDLAGVVRTAATDGTGPAAGTRVVGLTAGAFAERVAVDITALAEVPSEIDLAHAAALPVAGLAAYQALRAAGAGPGKHVLVTGASGGVGQFAVQLAAHAGARVIASIGTPGRGGGLRDAGAADVIIGLEGLQRPVDVVIDNVGGPQLVAAWQLLAPGGNLQSIGWSSGEPAVFPPYSTVGPPKSLTSFLIGGDVGGDLAALVRLLADGAIAVEIGWQGPWDQLAEAAGALAGRRVSGKAVLAVG